MNTGIPYINIKTNRSSNIDNKEDKTSFVSYSLTEGETNEITPTFNSYVAINGTVDGNTAVVVKLPKMEGSQNENSMQGFIVYFEPGNTPNFTSASFDDEQDSVVITENYTDIDSEHSYEVNYLWNGLVWAITVTPFVEYTNS